MGKLAIFKDYLDRKQEIDKKVEVEKKQEVIYKDNSKQLKAIEKAISKLPRKFPETDFAPIIKAMAKIKIPITDLSPVLKAIDSIPAYTDKIKKLEAKITKLEKKKRNFKFEVIRETFSDYIKEIRATET